MEASVGPSTWLAKVDNGTDIVIVHNVAGAKEISTKMTANGPRYHCTGTQLAPNAPPKYDHAAGTVELTYLGWYASLRRKAVIVCMVEQDGDYSVEVFEDTGNGVPGKQMNVDAQGNEIPIAGNAPYPRIVWPEA